MQYIHQDCLIEWLKYSRKEHCELCRHPFTFSPVYAQGSPEALPPHEFLIGLVGKTWQHVRFLLRVALVIASWLFLVPYFTYRVSVLAFARSGAETVAAYTVWPSTVTGAAIEVLCGTLLCVWIILLVLGLVALRDFITHNNIDVLGDNPPAENADAAALPDGGAGAAANAVAVGEAVAVVAGGGAAPAPEVIVAPAGEADAVPAAVGGELVAPAVLPAPAAAPVPDAAQWVAEYSASPPPPVRETDAMLPPQPSTPAADGRPRLSRAAEASPGSSDVLASPSALAAAAAERRMRAAAAAGPGVSSGLGVTPSALNSPAAGPVSPASIPFPAAVAQSTQHGASPTARAMPTTHVAFNTNAAAPGDTDEFVDHVIADAARDSDSAEWAASMAARVNMWRTQRRSLSPPPLDSSPPPNPLSGTGQDAAAHANDTSFVRPVSESPVARPLSSAPSSAAVLCEAPGVAALRPLGPSRRAPHFAVLPASESPRALIAPGHSVVEFDELRASDYHRLLVHGGVAFLGLLNADSELTRLRGDVDAAEQVATDASDAAARASDAERDPLQARSVMANARVTLAKAVYEQKKWAVWQDGRDVIVRHSPSGQDCGFGRTNEERIQDASAAVDEAIEELRDAELATLERDLAAKTSRISALRENLARIEQQQADAERARVDAERALAEAQRVLEQQQQQDPPAAPAAPAENGAAEGAGVLGALEDEFVFEEIVGLRGSLLSLVERIIFVLAFNIVAVGGFLLVPFNTSRLAQYAWQSFLGDPDAPGLKDGTTLMLGWGIYGLIFGTTLIYWSLSPPGGVVERTLASWVRFGFAAVKVCVLLGVELVVFPIAAGWTIDVCTLRVFDVPFAQRRAFLLAAPIISTLIHWGVGVLFMIGLGTFVMMLRDLLRQGVLWFLRDPHDPMFHPVREMLTYSYTRHVRRLVLSFGMYIVLVGLTIYAPLLLIRIAAPGVLPLQAQVTAPVAETAVPLDLLFFHVLLPFTLERFHVRAALKRAVKQWLQTVSVACGVDAYMLPPARPADPLPLEANPDHVPNFTSRITALVVLAWLTVLACVVGVVALPLVTGRTLLTALTGGTTHELYSYCVGFYALWASGYGTVAAVGYLRERAWHGLLQRIATWAVVLAKAAAVGGLWMLFVPLLAGLLFELLVLAPILIPLNQTPHMAPFMFQSWLWGLIVVKIWVKVVLNGPQDMMFRPQFDLIVRDGLANIHVFRILVTVIVPIVFLLLTALSVPYVVVHGVLPLLGVSPWVQQWVYRFGYMGAVAGWLGWKGTTMFFEWLGQTERELRDEKYKVGTTLVNCDVHSRSGAVVQAAGSQPL